jgi:hypothetical protein
MPEYHPGITGVSPEYHLGITRKVDILRLTNAAIHKIPARVKPKYHLSITQVSPGYYTKSGHSEQCLHIKRSAESSTW